MNYLSPTVIMRSLYRKLRTIDDEYVWHGALPPDISHQPEERFRQVLDAYRWHPAIDGLLRANRQEPPTTDPRIVTPRWHAAGPRAVHGLRGLAYGVVLSGLLTLPLGRDLAPPFAMIGGAAGFTYAFLRHRPSIPDSLSQWEYIRNVSERVRSAETPAAQCSEFVGHEDTGCAPR